MPETQTDTFKEIPSNTQVGWDMLKRSANYSDSMNFLEEVGLRPLTLNEVLSRLESDEQLKDSLKGVSFFLKEPGMEKIGYYSIGKDGVLVQGEGRSAEETVYAWAGEYPLLITIFSDEDAAKMGARFEIGAYGPMKIAQCVVGVSKDVPEPEIGRAKSMMHDVQAEHHESEHHDKPEISKFLRSNAALVIVDLQKGIASSGRQYAPYSADTVIRNAAKVADAFRDNDMPVFLVHVSASREGRAKLVTDDQFQLHGKLPDDWSDFVPELGPKGNDIIITKNQWGAFHGTDLERQLKEKGINTIVLCGISTNHGVESTARFAYEYGFQQIFIEDAMTSMSAELHNASIGAVFKKMGLVRNTEDILANLNPKS